MAKFNRSVPSARSPRLLHYGAAACRNKVNTAFFLIALMLVQPLQILWACGAQAAQTEKPALRFELTEEQATVVRPQSMKLASTVPLRPERLERLQQRMPVLKDSPSPKMQIPAQLLIRPKLPGDLAIQTFPASEKPLEKPSVAKEEKPLLVSRINLSGPVDIASELAVTFSQPMIAVQDLSTAGAPNNLPIKIEPQPPGKWRWLNTQTLLFKPANERFPKATVYKCTIPASTESLSGNKLSADKTWEISTSTTKVLQFLPGDNAQKPDALMAAAFNQLIDRDTVLQNIIVSDGKKKYALNMVSEEEIKKVFGANFQQDSSSSAVLGFRTVEPLPLNSRISVKFTRGLPSAEGPLRTTAVQEFVFHTHGPLRLAAIKKQRHEQEHEQSPEAWTPVTFEFSNQLEKNKFKQSMVRVTPSIRNFSARVGENTIDISGTRKAQTDYIVSFDKELTDVFGQKLGVAKPASFRTGSFESQFEHPEHTLIVIPYGKVPEYSFGAKGMQAAKVAIYREQPEDFLAAVAHELLPGPGETRPALPGKLVATRIVPVGLEAKVITIDLRPYLIGGLGNLYVRVDPVGAVGARWNSAAFQNWVVVTKIGLAAFTGADLTVVASSLGDGTPLAGIDCRVYPQGGKAVTTSSGIAKVSLVSGHSKIVVGRKGNDSVILPNYDYNPDVSFQKLEPTKEIKWYAVTDRYLYRPGEKVHVKGWARKVQFGAKQELQLLPPSSKKIKYFITDKERMLAQGTAALDESAGFSFEFELPKSVHLGDGRITLCEETGRAEQENESKGYFDFTVEEFRRPEFEMKVASSAGNSLILGEKTNLTAKATYYTGSPLSNASVRWSVVAFPTTYTPPGWSEFVFGHNEWSWMENEEESQDGSKTINLAGCTGSDGSHSVDLRFTSFNEPVPLACGCEAIVSDVNRQEWADKLGLLVHPSDRYVGLKGTKSFSHSGEKIDYEVVATDIDGKIMKDARVNLKLFLKGEKEKLVQEQNFTSKEQPVKVEFAPLLGGSYKMVATISDAQGRVNETTLSHFVDGDQPASPISQKIEQQKVILISDRKEYKPGDTALILVRSPFVPATGVVTVRHHDIVRTIPLSLAKNTQSISVPIDESLYPNATIQVDLVGSQCAYATGMIEVDIPPTRRKLDIVVEPAAAVLNPGGDTTIALRLKDAEGKPVSGQIAIAVADEAVLALADYKWPNPFETFYSKVQNFLGATHLREFVVFPEKETARLGRPGEDSSTSSSPPPPPPIDLEPAGRVNQPIPMRSDFSPLALFEPAIQTDAEGVARVKLHLPDNLTRYRIMAAAVADMQKYGLGESAVTARLPLMVRPSAPRFLNFGDTCELPVVLHNQTDAPLKIEVAMRSNNAILLGDQQSAQSTNENRKDQQPQPPGGEVTAVGKELEVPARDRIEVRFPIQTKHAGEAKFQFAAASGDIADGAEVSIPIMVPATTEAFAAYGQIDEGAALQQILPVSEAYPEVGGLELSTSSTSMQALTDAYFYLKDYNFECSEQISSRMLAMLSLKDVLGAFGQISAADEGKLAGCVRRDIAALASRQYYDGNFALWQPGEPQKWPYLSLQVYRALLLAQTKAFVVDPKVLVKAKSFLRDIDSHVPKECSRRERVALQSYALFIRYLQGDVDGEAARRVIHDAVKVWVPAQSPITAESLAGIPVEKLPEAISMDAVGWLYPVVTKNSKGSAEEMLLRRLIDNQIHETASTASLSGTGYGDNDYMFFYSPTRSDAIILEALIHSDPSNSIIPKLAKGLLASRKKGRWQGTQENCYVLLALERYFSKYEATEPNFEVQSWLRDAYIGSQRFSGRSAKTELVSIPMEWLSKQKGRQDLLINKTGPGRLYYRVGLNYAPLNLKLPAKDSGFTVNRTYESVDDPGDVKKDENGIWHIKQGSTVRVKVKFAAGSPRYHVALMDPLPGGAEAVNPELSGSRHILVNDAREGHYSPMPWWNWPWFDHQNLRDRQVEAFASVLNGGIYDYTYLMRATTPGVYIVPPSRAEEMYAPESFGRSPTDTVRIE